MGESSTPTIDAASGQAQNKSSGSSGDRGGNRSLIPGVTKINDIIPVVGISVDEGLLNARTGLSFQAKSKVHLRVANVYWYDRIFLLFEGHAPLEIPYYSVHRTPISSTSDGGFLDFEITENLAQNFKDGQHIFVQVFSTRSPQYSGVISYYLTFKAEDKEKDQKGKGKKGTGAGAEGGEEGGGPSVFEELGTATLEGIRQAVAGKGTAAAASTTPPPAATPSPAAQKSAATGEESVLEEDGGVADFQAQVNAGAEVAESEAQAVEGEAREEVTGNIQTEGGEVSAKVAVPGAIAAAATQTTQTTANVSGSAQAVSEAATTVKTSATGSVEESLQDRSEGQLNAQTTARATGDVTARGTQTLNSQGQQTSRGQTTAKTTKSGASKPEGEQEQQVSGSSGQSGSAAVPGMKANISGNLGGGEAEMGGQVSTPGKGPKFSGKVELEDSNQQRTQGGGTKKVGGEEGEEAPGEEEVSPMPATLAGSMPIQQTSPIEQATEGSPAEEPEQELASPSEAEPEADRQAREFVPKALGALKPSLTQPQGGQDRPKPKTEAPKPAARGGESGTTGEKDLGQAGLQQPGTQETGQPTTGARPSEAELQVGPLSPKLGVEPDIAEKVKQLQKQSAALDAALKVKKPARPSPIKKSQPIPGRTAGGQPGIGADEEPEEEGENLPSQPQPKKSGKEKPVGAPLQMPREDENAPSAPKEGAPGGAEDKDKQGGAAPGTPPKSPGSKTGQKQASQRRGGKTPAQQPGGQISAQSTTSPTTKEELQPLITEANQIVNAFLMKGVVIVWAGALETLGLTVLAGAIIGNLLPLVKGMVIRRTLTPLLTTEKRKQAAEQVINNVKVSNKVKLNILVMNLLVILVPIILFFIIMIAGCNFPVPRSLITLNTYRGTALGLVIGDKCEPFDLNKMVGNAVSNFTNNYVTPPEGIGPLSTTKWDTTIGQLSSQYGLNACVLKTVVQKESGGQDQAIGCDCAANGHPEYCLDKSKTYYSGYQFNWDQCSYGIGITQWTIYPKGGTGYKAWQSASTPSRNLLGDWYGVNQLLDANTSLGLTAKYFAANMHQHNPAGPPYNASDVQAAFATYVGQSSIQDKLVADRMALYNLCVTNFSPPPAPTN